MWALYIVSKWVANQAISGLYWARILYRRRRNLHGIIWISKVNNSHLPSLICKRLHIGAQTRRHTTVNDRLRKLGSDVGPGVELCYTTINHNFDNYHGAPAVKRTIICALKNKEIPCSLCQRLHRDSPKNCQITTATARRCSLIQGIPIILVLSYIHRSNECRIAQISLILHSSVFGDICARSPSLFRPATT